MLSEAFHKIKATNLKASNRSRQKLEIEQRKQKKASKKLQLQMEIREHKSNPFLIEEEIIKSFKENSSKQRLEKNAFVGEAYDICIGNIRNSSRKTELLNPRKEKKESRRSKTKLNVLQSKWRNIQNQERCDKTRTGKKRKVNLEKTEFLISIKLEVSNIFKQQGT